MLQNVHRGGQGQTLGLVNPSTPSPSSPSSPSSPPPPSFALLAHQQFQRPTTYRPTLRREDPSLRLAQPVADYRIANSLQTQEPHRLRQSAFYPPQPGTTAQIAHEYGDDDSASLDDATAYQEKSGDDDRAPSPSLSVEKISRVADEPRPNSYARLLRFQGDRRVDSFVRY